MIPRLAALSTAAIAARICSALGLSEERTCLCIVRSRVTTLRLRTDRFKVWRARLAADLVLAMVKLKLRGRGCWRRNRDCQLRKRAHPNARARPLRARNILSGHRALVQHRCALTLLRFSSFCSKGSRHSHLLGAERA